jgi:hypothetical protein
VWCLRNLGTSRRLPSSLPSGLVFGGGSEHAGWDLIIPRARESTAPLRLSTYRVDLIVLDLMLPGGVARMYSRPSSGGHGVSAPPRRPRCCARSSQGGPLVRLRTSAGGPGLASAATIRPRWRSVSEPIVLLSESCTAARTCSQRAGPQRCWLLKSWKTDIVSISVGQLRSTSEGLVAPLAILRFSAARETRISFACWSASARCLPPGVDIDAVMPTSSCSPLAARD